MTTNHFTATFSVNPPPAVVYAAINDVRSWWLGDITGSTQAVGDVFTYRSGDLHESTHQIVELTEASRVVWLVTGARLTFTSRPDEWVGTTIVFDIRSTADGSEVHFEHHGLDPSLECFDGCSEGWTYFLLQHLQPRIDTR